MAELPADPIAPPVAKPCPSCPFNRKVSPGALGGSPVETYIGQIHGPFVIACHMHIDFRDPTWDVLHRYATTPQCAGAAIFRANCHITNRLPKSIPRAAANRDIVFSNVAEFAAHHSRNRRLSARVFKAWYTPLRIMALVKEQIQRAQNGERP